MPTGLPSASDIMAQKVVSFSLDTQIFESKGFKYFTGDLSVLQNQIPSWVNISLSDIIIREVLSHRVRKANESNQALKSAISTFHRNTGLDRNQSLSAQHEALNYEKVIVSNFELEMNDFLSELRGEILVFDKGRLAQEMFKRYFNIEAPFCNKKEKKNEFPDAAALLTLEYAAKQKKKYTILVSNDTGWSDFAAKSDWLYCVKSLDDLTELFESNTPESQLVENQIQLELQKPDSKLFKKLVKKVAIDLPDMEWSADEVYTGFSARLEPEVSSVEILKIIPDRQNLKLWFAMHDPSICIAEVLLTVDVKVGVSAEFFAYDSIDRDEFSIGSGDALIEQTVDVVVYLEFSGDLINNSLSDWDIEVILAIDSFSVESVEMEPDYSEQD